MKKKDIYHITNPLIVFCRLRDLGIEKKWALKIVMVYEVTLFKVIKLFLRKYFN